MKFVAVLCGRCPAKGAPHAELARWMETSRVFIEAATREGALAYARTLDRTAVVGNAFPDDEYAAESTGAAWVRA
jgi:hypothetical protein